MTGAKWSAVVAAFLVAVCWIVQAGTLQAQPAGSSRNSVAKQAGSKNKQAIQAYEAASKLVKQEEYLKARQKLRRALELDPRYKDAKDLLVTVEEKLGHPTSAKLLQKALEEFAVEKGRLQRLLVSRIESGKELLARHEYDQALSLFNLVKTSARLSPYRAELAELEKQADALASRTQVEKANYLSRLEEERRLEAQRLLREHTVQQERDYRNRVKALLDRARQERQAGRYEQAVLLCEAVLKVDPVNREAVTLYEKIEREDLKQRYAWIESTKRHETRKALWQTAEEAVPYVLPLMRYPRDWENISESRKKLFAPPGIEISPEDQRVQNKLNNRVSIDFVETPLSEVMEFLKTFGDFNILVDKAGLERAVPGGEPLVTLKLSDVTIDTALKFITEPLGLSYGIRDGVLVISDVKGVEGKSYLVIYDVRDLLGAVPDYTPPSLDLDTSTGGGGEGGGGYRGGGGGGGGGDFFEGEEGEEEFKPATVTGQELVDLITSILGLEG